MAIIDFGGVKERVVTRKEFPLAKARKVLKNEVIAVIGYGVQGPAQSLNMKDNGFNVIIGQAPEFKRDWDRAVKDGWVPGKTLFDIEDGRADAARSSRCSCPTPPSASIWPSIKKHLKAGDALYFSHGFSIVYKKQTGVIPPKNVDVIMVAPKGSGTDRSAAISSPARASTPATRSSRTTPAAPRSAAWPSASASARATCSRPRSSTKSTAI